jgi:hypothetical protein
MPQPRFGFGATEEEIRRAHRRDDIENYVIIVLLLAVLIVPFLFG